MFFVAVEDYCCKALLKELVMKAIMERSTQAPTCYSKILNNVRSALSLALIIFVSQAYAADADSDFTQNEADAWMNKISDLGDSAVKVRDTPEITFKMFVDYAMTNPTGLAESDWITLARIQFLELTRQAEAPLSRGPLCKMFGEDGHAQVTAPEILSTMKRVDEESTVRWKAYMDSVIQSLSPAGFDSFSQFKAKVKVGAAMDMEAIANADQVSFVKMVRGNCNRGRQQS